MSTAGAGAVAAVGVGVGGVVLLAGGALIGAGILLGRGIMWCGEKLEENYQHACQEWTNLVEAARAENLANVQEVGSYLFVQLDRMAASAYLTVNQDTPTSPLFIESKDILAAIAQTRSAIEDAQQITHSRADTENALLASRLQSEIVAGRGILPEEQIAAAQEALHGSPDTMRSALSELQSAWNKVTEAQALHKRNTRQTQQVLQTVRVQLAAVETMLHEMKRGNDFRYKEQQRAIEEKMREAQDYLNIDVPTALAMANQARQAVRTLVDAVSADAVTAWSNSRKEINTLRGVLDSLLKMTKEASAIQLVDREKAESLIANIEKAQHEAQTLLEGSVPHVAQRISRLSGRVALLKEDVFKAVKTNQQRTVAQTITDTLAELGFTSSTGERLLLKQNGDVMRVEAMSPQKVSTSEHDERVVAFDVSPDGNVSYDFSGYVGDTCLHDAQRIFAALRAKGIFILDSQATQDLQELPTESITAETLSQERFQPQIVRNKTQAELAETIRRVLERMNYAQVRQNTIGGAIELEAFNGPVGYRVVLPPDGSAQILKDASHVDVSSDSRDPIVAEAQRAIQQASQAAQKEQMKAGRPKLTRRQQQMLGQ